jgi:hypothetical protein
MKSVIKGNRSEKRLGTTVLEGIVYIKHLCPYIIILGRKPY